MTCFACSIIFTGAHLPKPQGNSRPLLLLFLIVNVGKDGGDQAPDGHGD